MKNHSVEVSLFFAVTVAAFLNIYTICARMHRFSRLFPHKIPTYAQLRAQGLQNFALSVYVAQYWILYAFSGFCKLLNFAKIGYISLNFHRFLSEFREMPAGGQWVLFFFATCWRGNLNFQKRSWKNWQIDKLRNSNFAKSCRHPFSPGRVWTFHCWTWTSHVHEASWSRCFLGWQVL